MSNKTLKTMLILLVVIILAGAGAVYFILQQQRTGTGNKGPTIDEISRFPKIFQKFTTNLASEIM